MTESLFWWVTQFSVNFLDFVMVYVITQALMNRRIKINFKHMALAILYTLIVAPTFYFWGGYTIRIIGILFSLFAIKLMTKRGIGDVLIMFGLCFVILGIIQLPVVGIILIIDGMLNLNQSLVFLIAQVVTTVIIVLICKRFKLNQWFYAFRTNLKWTLFIVTFIITFFMFFFNFDYNNSNFLFFTIIILLIGIALFPILMQLYHHFIGIISIHDLNNSLLSMGIAIEQMDNIEEIKTMIRNHSKKFGMDLSQLNVKKFDDDMDYMELMTKRVNEFIQIKTKTRNKNIEIVSDITYHKDYADVSFELMLTWLGTLLDNALDTTVNHPIYLDISVTTNRMLLRMANEYTDQEEQNIQVIFEKGYSTKGIGRGIGLHNLHREATEKGAEITVDKYYTEAHHCYYLEITLYFKKEGVIGH